MSSVLVATAWTKAGSWLINKMATPASLISMILAKDCSLNSASPTAKTSSTMRISGSQWAATENASRTYIPDE